MRRVLAAILKIIAVAVLLVGVCLYVLVNHSTVTQELTCKGYWKELGQDKEVAEVAHVQLTEYRWWLFGESYGNVKVQTEKFALAHYIPFVHKLGEGSLAIYEFRRSKSGDLQGGYRAANGEITLKFTDNLVFVGTSCRPRATANGGVTGSRGMAGHIDRSRTAG
jgi:hypothetical protein